MLDRAPLVIRRTIEQPRELRPCSFKHLVEASGLLLSSVLDPMSARRHIVDRRSDCAQDSSLVLRRRRDGIVGVTREVKRGGKVAT